MVLASVGPSVFNPYGCGCVGPEPAHIFPGDDVLAGLTGSETPPLKCTSCRISSVEYFSGLVGHRPMWPTRPTVLLDNNP